MKNKEVTLNLNELEIEYIRSLQNEYNKLKNEEKDIPKIYWLIDKQTIYGIDNNYDYDNIIYTDDDGGQWDSEEELMDYYKNDYLKEGEEFDWENDKYNFMADRNINKVYCKNVDKKEKLFLTKESAENHLKSNHYHYNEEAYISEENIWRNETLKTMLQLIYNINLK